jgi:TonB family protein
MHVHYQKGITLFLNRQYKLAESEFRLELTESPEYSSAHAMLSMSMLQQLKFDQALHSAKEAVRLAPDLAYGHYALASANYRKGKLDVANREIKEALRLDPNDSFYYARAAEIKMVERQLKQALEFADAGLGIDPNSLNCLVDRANILVKLNQLDAAEVAADLALHIDPEEPSAHIAKGLILLHKSAITESFNHYREALRLAPHSMEARKGVAVTLKARYPFYNKMLSASLWIGRLDKRILAVAILVLLLSPAKALPGLIVLLLAAGNSLFSLLLRFDPVGRSILTEQEIKRSNYGLAAIALFLVLVSVAIFAALNETRELLFRNAEADVRAGRFVDANHKYDQLREKANDLRKKGMEDQAIAVRQRIIADEQAWAPSRAIDDSIATAHMMMHVHDYAGAAQCLRSSIVASNSASNSAIRTAKPATDSDNPDSPDTKPESDADNADGKPETQSENADGKPATRSDNASSRPETHSDNASSRPETHSDNADSKPEPDSPIPEGKPESHSDIPEGKPKTDSRIEDKIVQERVLLAACLSKQGKPDEAEEQYKLAIDSANLHQDSKILTHLYEQYAIFLESTRRTPPAKYAPSVLFAHYLPTVQRAIKKNWHPPKETASNRVTVLFDTTRDGQLKTLKIEKSSGDRSVDESALKAVRASVPFPEFPRGATDESVSIEFTFDYNVWNKGQKVVPNPIDDTKAQEKP